MEKVWEPISMVFADFSKIMRNWWEKQSISHVIKYTIGWESNGKDHPYYGKSMSTNSPGSPHTMGIVGYSLEPISQTFSIRWDWLFFPMLSVNTCITHVMKCTRECESNWKKAPILWQNYEYQFPRFSPYDGFCCLFLYYGKLMWKPMHFPYDEVYHRMGILWGKTTHASGKVWVSISQVQSIRWALLHFLIR